MPIKSTDTGTDLPVAKACYGSAQSLVRQPRRCGFDKNWRAVQNKTTNSCKNRTRRLHQIRVQKRHRSAHQGWTCDKPGYVETGRSPLDSRAAAAIAGSGVRMGGTAW